MKRDLLPQASESSKADTRAKKEERQKQWIKTKPEHFSAFACQKPALGVRASLACGAVRVARSAQNEQKKSRI